MSVAVFVCLSPPFSILITASDSVSDKRWKMGADMRYIRSFRKKAKLVLKTFADINYHFERKK